MSRWNEIAQSVLENIADAGLRDVSRERVLRQLSKAQTDIARRTLNIQADSEIDTVVSQAAYKLDESQFRIRELFQPQAWVRPIEIVFDDAIWRRIIESHHTYAQPLFATIRNAQFILNPAPSDVQTITLWTYALPTLIPSATKDDDEHSTDPELGPELDDALEYSCTAAMLLKSSDNRIKAFAPQWLNRVEEEIRKVGQQNLREALVGTISVDHSSKRLGF